MLAASRTEALHKSPEGLSAQNVPGSSAHVTLTDERPEPVAEVNGLLCVMLGEQVSQVFHHHKRVVVGFEEPVGVLEVVGMDVLKGPDGLPVQLRSALADVQPHGGEVGALRAHVQNLVTVFSPGGTNMLELFQKIFRPRHDPAQHAHTGKQGLRQLI